MSDTIANSKHESSLQAQNLLKLDKGEEALQTATRMNNPELSSLIQIEALIRQERFELAMSTFEASTNVCSQNWHQEVCRLFFEKDRFNESRRILEKAVPRFATDDAKREDLILSLILVSTHTGDHAQVLIQYISKCKTYCCIRYYSHRYMDYS